MSLSNTMAISLKLIVDKEKNKVLFAECHSDFIDVLFSLLMLPLGTVVKLLDKQSGLGCMDNLYQSVENLDTNYLETKTCKAMLLEPRSPRSQNCQDVLVKIGVLGPKMYFACPNSYRTCLTLSSVSSAICTCGLPSNRTSSEVQLLNEDISLINPKAIQFLVLDDLLIMQNCIDSMLLLEKLGIEDSTVLQETTVELNKTELLVLLKQSFHSKTPLTDVFLRTDAGKAAQFRSIRDVKIEKCDATTKTRPSEPSKSNKITVKILETKTTNKLVNMESDNDFADLLFSFLTLPLGYVLFLLGKDSFALGCIENIYNSVNDLKEEILSAKNKDKLLKPKLAGHFVCSNTVLNLEENQSLKPGYNELNPKLPRPSCEKGGGYARSGIKFMITPEMIVKPFSTFGSIQLLKDRGVSVNDLKKTSATIGESEATKLLKCCLTARTLPDNSIFSLSK